MNTPLHKCAQYAQYPETAKLLINHGAKVNSQNKYGYTPLHQAAGNDDTSVSRILLENGADPNIKDKWGRAPIHMAIEMNRRNSAKFLIKYPETDVNAQDNDNKTALHQCSSYGYLEICILLIEHGAILDLKNKQGQTPLDTAVEQKQYEIIKLLEKAINRVKEQDSY